jgi:hypothetical protein
VSYVNKNMDNNLHLKNLLDIHNPAAIPNNINLPMTHQKLFGHTLNVNHLIINYNDHNNQCNNFDPKLCHNCNCANDYNCNSDKSLDKENKIELTPEQLSKILSLKRENNPCCNDIIREIPSCKT